MPGKAANGSAAAKFAKTRTRSWGTRVAEFKPAGTLPPDTRCTSRALALISWSEYQRPLQGTFCGDPPPHFQFGSVHGDGGVNGPPCWQQWSNDVLSRR